MGILAELINDFNPFVFKVGTFGPRWYGVAYLMGFLCAYLLIKRLSKEGMLRLVPERVPDFVLNCCIFGVLIGGRLGYVLFYNLPNALKAGETPMLWDFSSSIPFWSVLRVWDGGMSAHGGVVFTILTLIYFARRQRVSVINLGDAACMVVPIGLFFGRIANFINGELYGRPAVLPWAFKFPSEVSSPTNDQMDPGVFERLPEVYEKLHLPLNYADPALPEQGLSALRRLLSQHNHDAVQAVAAIVPARHPSQLYEALLEGALLFAICWTIGRIWRKDGMASGAFLTLYPVMRIIGEQFRVGDTPVHFIGMEISKGVLYSLPMALAGAIYWGYWIRRDRRVPWVPVVSTAAPEPTDSPISPPTAG